MTTASEQKPTLTAVTFSGANRLIQLKFSEPIVAHATSLHTAITLDRNTADEEVGQMLSGTDKVTIKGNFVTIALTMPLTGSTLRLQIAAHSVRDAVFKSNEMIYSPLFSADEQKPLLK